MVGYSAAVALLLAHPLLLAAAAPDDEDTLTRPRCSVQDAAQAAGSVWMLCNTREVFVTTDSGKTWLEGKVPGDFKLRTIAALDRLRAFVAGDQGNLWASADQGKTWQKQDASTDATLTDIHFLGDLGWISGYSGVVLHTRDSGHAWAAQPTVGSESVEAIYFADPKNGIAVGWGGAILRTTDGGAKWERIRSPAALWSCNSVFMRDANNAWAVGMSGQLLRTKDGGATWTGQRLEAVGSLSSVMFDKKGTGWITSDRDVFTSTDGGESWKPSGMNEWVFLNKIIEVGAGLWAVGPLQVLTKSEKGWEQLKSWYIDVTDTSRLPARTPLP